MIDQTPPQLSPGEDIIHSWQPHLSVYLLSVLAIASLTAVCFVIALFTLLPYSTALQNSSAILPFAVLLAIGFHRPFAWLRVRHSRYFLTNRAVILQSLNDGEIRMPLSDLSLDFGMWPWNIGVSSEGTSSISIEYVDLNWQAKTAVKQAINLANGKRSVR